MMAWRSSFEPAPEKEEWPLSREEFEARLRRVGEERYHDKHRFHDRLHGGACTMDEVQAWVINRWQYQCSIPMKDAAFLSRCPDPDLRRIWRYRIEDHDGGTEDGGGIRRWLRLAEAVGLDPAYVASGRDVMPATRFIVDAYIRFVRDEPLIAAMASSLTEMFAPVIHTQRISGLLEHYDFADRDTIAFPPPPERGAEGRTIHARLGLDPRRDPRRAGGSYRGADIQDGCPVGAARRAVEQLCRWSHPARRLAAR